MIRALAQIALNGLGVVVAAYLVPGIHYSGDILYLLLTGLVIGALNLLVKPLVTLLSLPLIVLTLGLFFLVINGLMLLVASGLLSGLEIDGCLPAILGGLVLGIFNWLVRAFTPE
ncbi:MAG: phage holin family protein [bacterium]|nr:phage holin family protein [bacterium]